MIEDTIQIVTKDNRVITLQEFFEGNRETHKEQAKLPFEEKIRILVTLQKLAVEWGRRNDVMIWET